MLDEASSGERKAPSSKLLRELLLAAAIRLWMAMSQATRLAWSAPAERICTISSRNCWRCASVA